MGWDRKQPPLITYGLSLTACLRMCAENSHAPSQEAWSQAGQKCTCVVGFIGPTGKHEERGLLFEGTNGKWRWGDRVWGTAMWRLGGRQVTPSDGYSTWNELSFSVVLFWWVEDSSQELCRRNCQAQRKNWEQEWWKTSIIPLWPRSY